MGIKKLFEHFPLAEVLARNLYWRISFLQKVASTMAKGQAAPSQAGGFSDDELVAALRRKGVTEHDVIVVHSSMTQLAKSGLGPAGIIESLTRKLCPKGTLVCPTFPLYIDEPKGTSRLT